MAYKVKVGKFTVECDTLQEVKSLISDEKPAPSPEATKRANKAWVTRKSVNGRHRRLKNADTHWSDSDIVAMKNVYENNKGLRMKRKNMRKLMAILGRTRAAISTKASELSLTRVYRPDGVKTKPATMLSKLKKSLANSTV